MTDLRTILAEGLTADHSLSSMYEIEDILLLIGEVNRKIDYYKEMKKHRASSIDEKISSLNAKAECLRSVILNTMQKVVPNEKTLDFPDIGKVTRRKPTATISIDDQDKVIGYLDDKGMKDEVVKVSETVDKRKLKTIVQQCSKTGEKVPGVSTITGDESLSITFEKPKEDAAQADAATTEISLDALDSLVV